MPKSGRKGRGSALKLEPGKTETHRTSHGAKDSLQQLLPEIPDELTLDLIVPKLSWKALRVLSSSSRAWRRATQGREVYNSRVRARSTETFVVFLDRDAEESINKRQRVIALYSVRGNYFVELPLLPRLHRKEERWWQIVSMDGKLFGFGLRPGATCISSFVDVYLLDLTGQQWEWEHCGTMEEPTFDDQRGAVHGFGAIGGNLYLFRPEFSSDFYDLDSNSTIVQSLGFTSEIYDPKSNSWSARKAMPSVRFDYLIAPLGEELLVYGGTNSDERCDEAQSLEVYNPLKDEWRVVGDWRPEPRDDLVEAGPALFTAKGKIYSMDNKRIFVLDPEKQSSRQPWKRLYRIGETEYLWPLKVLAVDDELLGILQQSYGGTCLARSRGFGKGMTSLMWEEIKLSGPLAKDRDLGPNLGYCEMVSIQL